MRTRRVSGTALRATREDRELTGPELAEQVGVDSSLIYKIEVGDRQPSAKVFGRICRALGADKADLLEDPEEVVPSA